MCSLSTDWRWRSSDREMPWRPRGTAVGGGGRQSRVTWSHLEPLTSLHVAGNTGGAAQQRPGLRIPELSRGLHQVRLGGQFTQHFVTFFFQSQDFSKMDFLPHQQAKNLSTCCKWYYGKKRKLNTKISRIRLSGLDSFLFLANERRP